MGLRVSGSEVSCGVDFIVDVDAGRDWGAQCVQCEPVGHVGTTIITELVAQSIWHFMANIHVQPKMTFSDSSPAGITKKEPSIWPLAQWMVAFKTPVT